MRKYLKYFAWLFLLNGILAAILIAITVVKEKTAENNPYVRTNKECLTEERVFDLADKLTEEQEEKLRQLIAERQEQIGCDIVLVTINEAVPNLRDFADDFYDENKFGYDKPWGDGAIYVDNWETEEVWFSTSGRVERKFSDEMINHLLDRTCDALKSSPYHSYCTYVDTLYHSMLDEPMFAGLIPDTMPFGVAFLVSAIYLLVNLAGNKGKKTTTASTYVTGGKPIIKNRQDIFLNKSVVTHHIESSSRSGHSGGGGHHTSSGGHSHGGGGRHH